MTAKRDAPRVEPVIERLVKALVVTAKAVTLYPPASSIPRDTAQEAAAILGQALEERHEVRLVVTKQGIYHNDVLLFAGESAYGAFALELYSRKLAEVRFHSGTTAKDIMSFLSLLSHSPEDLEAAGGFEARLWDRGVGTITVREARITLVDAEAVVGGEEESGPDGLSRSGIDEILAGAYGGRSRDQLTIARLLGDRGTVSSYLTSTYTSSGVTSNLLGAGERFAEFAEIAYAAGEAERSPLMGSLGEAFGDLDPSLKRALLVEQILPEARTNGALAAFVQQMDVNELCEVIVADMDAGSVHRQGLARAIRNLSLISMSSRGDIVSAAGTAMRGVGFDEKTISEVTEMALPSRLTVREQAGGTPAAETPAAAIFRLIDLAPTDSGGASTVEQSDLTALRVEARRGITDGDVIMTSVSLVTMDPSDSHFSSAMAILEDSLDMLIERGDIDIAADAADALSAAADNEALSQEQRTRLRKAIGRFTRPEDIRTVAHSLRIYEPGTVEYRAAQRILGALGPLAIEPMLEQLADEPDMAVRKSLVDLLCSMAPAYVAELGVHVTDPRWYVARNVVKILGSTRSSSALPFLERTVRHPEPRVRREVVRALSVIPDRAAQELLVAALSDEDAQNVQLAARYLGAADVRGAIPALEQVARGEGMGSRATGPRVEAIEALGRLKATQSLHTLEYIVGKRSILGAGKARELRAAAEAAIARIGVANGGRS